MKFLCDAERCIECNGCVTACKQDREVMAAEALIADTDLFALRALSRLSLPDLVAFGPNPAAAWRAGDARVIGALAARELTHLGLRRPALPQPGGA